MGSIREAAVAGSFYPQDRATLSGLLDTYISQPNPQSIPPKALIAPHAGYVYSGEIAGAAYTKILPRHGEIKRVVLLGPSHHVGFRGMALPTSQFFRTPLGDIPIDTDAIGQISKMKNVNYLDAAHVNEHSLEVQLPFLQKVIDDFKIIPIVVGDCEPKDVCNLIESLWGGPETLIVVSTDLSHFESYEVAQHKDQQTSDKISSLDATLTGHDACGARPLNGLLRYAKKNNLKVDLISIKNSGDTAGTKDRVVGYGAYSITDAVLSEELAPTFNQPEWKLSDRQRLLQLAREAIRSPLEGEKNYHIELGLFAESLRVERATFVTLKIDGGLRGCIGSLIAHRPLVLDVAYNAQAAAFKDPRFPALSAREYAAVDVHISILSTPKLIEVASREELVASLQPGIDGLIIRDGSCQATYLPSVWTQIPDPEQFVFQLRVKAGLRGDSWSATTEVLRYGTEEFC